MNRDYPECDTLAEATHQAPPGHFAAEHEENCVGCVFADADGSGCSRRAQFGADAEDKYPCDYDPDDEDADGDGDSEPTIYYIFKPLSEWKFGNEE